MALSMDSRKIIFGLLMVVFGLLLLGRTLDIFYFTFGEMLRFLMAFVFILVGIWLIVRKKDREVRFQAHVQFGDSHTSTGPSAASTPPHGPQPAGQGADTEIRKAKYSKLLGDLFIDCANIRLENVEISMGVGDTEIKLHGGRLSRGLNRMVISGFVGDIRIFIPQDMPYYAHCSNFIGNIDAGGQRADGFSNTIESQSADYEAAESKLYIAANNFIGDIKLFLI